MKIKEKVIRKSISILEKKISKIDELLNSITSGKVIELVKERNSILASGINEENINLASKVQDKINEQLKILSKPRNTTKLIKLKVKYEFELIDLNNELYFLTKK